MNTPSISNNQIGSSMLPFVMSELTSLVMKKKALAFDDALHYIYSSRLYRSLLDENAKQWYSSTLLLFEELEKEKTEEKRKKNDDKKVQLFKVFCIENFRESKKMMAEETLLLFSKHKVFDFLEDTFEMLHTQDLEYIIDTITTYIKKRK